MWPFKKKEQHKTIGSTIANNADGSVSIDVRGQTCPGYLLSINKAMDTLNYGTQAYLITSYAPCGDDVKAWCKEKGYEYGGIVQGQDSWKVSVLKTQLL